jgi:hypothetical protein
MCWFALPWVLVALIFTGFLVFQIQTASAAGYDNRWGDNLPYEYNISPEITRHAASVLAQFYALGDPTAVILVLGDPATFAYHLAVGLAVVTVEEKDGKQVISRKFLALDRFGNPDLQAYVPIKVVTEAQIQEYFNYQEV